MALPLFLLPAPLILSAGTGLYLWGSKSGGVLQQAKLKLNHLVLDEDIAIAIENCFTACLYNEKTHHLFKDSNSAQAVANVIWAYITYYVEAPEEHKNLKYYYDEFADRHDPWRAKLVQNIADIAQDTPERTNAILSYLYWAIKRKKVSKDILRPRESKRFYKKDWWYNDSIFYHVYKFTQDMYNTLTNLIKKVGYAALDIVEGVAEGAKNLGNVSFNLLKYAPYILLVGGGGYFYLQYKNNKNFLDGIKQLRK